MGPTGDLTEIRETLGEVLTRQAASHPDHDFVVLADRGLRFTYAAFDSRVDALARGLMSIGIRKGDHVGIWATNVPDWLTYLFAAARIGAVAVTVNTAYRTHELEYLVRQSDMKALCLVNGFRDADYVAMAKELIPELAICERGALRSARFPRLESVIFMGPEKHRGMYTTPELLLLGAHLPDRSRAQAAAACRCDEVINMQYTSGTTGFPKGVMLTHHNILNNGFAIGKRQRFTQDERVCLTVPLFHCFGLVLGMMAVVTHGATAAWWKASTPCWCWHRSRRSAAPPCTGCRRCSSRSSPTRCSPCSIRAASAPASWPGPRVPSRS